MEQQCYLLPLSALFFDSHAFDQHFFYRHVLMNVAPVTGSDAFDLVHHVHTFYDFTEYAVTPTVWCFRFEVQEGVVVNVDEELGAC